MSEESPITNPELYNEIDAEVEGKAVQVIERKPRRRRRRRNDDEIPLSLDKISGKEVMEILDFLHRRYLSWLTEAEATKFSTVYRSAKEEALKESLEIYSEIQKQNQQMLEQLNRLAEKLGQIQGVAPPQQLAKETAEEIKKSLLDDPRVRSLIFVMLESFLGKNEQYQKFRPFIAQLLIPEAFQPPRQETRTPKETGVEGVENQVNSNE